MTQNNETVASNKRNEPDTVVEDETVTKKQLTEALHAKDDQIARLEATVEKLVDKKESVEKPETSSSDNTATGKQVKQDEPAPLVSTGNNPTVPVVEKDNKVKSSLEQSDIERGPAPTTSVDRSKAVNAAPEILETGHIYFFYRPKVMLEEAHNLDEVQRFYILLSPNTVKGEENEKIVQKESKSPHRILLIPKKTLPSPQQHDKFYAVVAQVTESVEELKTSLGAKQYETKTQGQRDLEAARILGQGVYAIVAHQTQSHLAYVLEYPEDLSEAQKVFNIEKESSFQLSMKNPVTTQPASLNLSELFDQGTGFSSTNKVKEYPEELQKIFRSNRWCPANPPTFLDHLGAEMLFIGVNDNLVAEFGEVGKKIEEMEKQDVDEEANMSHEEPSVEKMKGEETFVHLRGEKGLRQPIILGSQWNSKEE